MGLRGSKTVLLSSSDLKRVQDSWKIVMQNAEENGVIILKTFLDRHNYYGYFKKFSGIPISELPENKVFRRHAASIMETLNKAALHVGDDSLLKADLESIGKLHTMKNVTEQQFQELKAVILDILEGEFNLPIETIGSWNKALSIAFFYIKEGLTHQ